MAAVTSVISRPNGSRVSVLINGTPVFLGLIVATTTKNNTDTATPFNTAANGLAGKALLIQSDTECFILPSASSTGTVTTANGVKVGADEKVIIIMGPTYGWLAGLAVTGTSNIRVWELL